MGMFKQDDFVQILAEGNYLDNDIYEESTTAQEKNKKERALCSAQADPRHAEQTQVREKPCKLYTWSCGESSVCSRAGINWLNWAYAGKETNKRKEKEQIKKINTSVKSKLPMTWLRTVQKDSCKVINWQRAAFKLFLET